MAYTVNTLAKLAGISVRTLHYYDQIGLLSPKVNDGNGYRQYGKKELLRLQQILFFRELEFSLKEIRQILDTPNCDPLGVLMDQKHLLQLEKVRLENIIKTIELTINTMKNNTPITDKELYEGLTKKQIEEYKEEAKQRWGNTQAYRQSAQRTKKWTKADWIGIKQEQDQLMKDLVKTMDKGAQSPQAQALIKQHHNSINQFYDCSIEFYRNLGNMYITDERFTAYYEKYEQGLAQFMHQAMMFYCDTQEKS